jgi:hypothetical protein
MKCLLPAPPCPLRAKILIWSTKFDFSTCAFTFSKGAKIRIPGQPGWKDMAFGDKGPGMIALWASQNIFIIKCLIFIVYQ